MATSRHTDFVLYRRLLGQVRPYWPHLTGILLLSLLSAPLALLNPLPLKIAVDSVIGTHPLPRFLERLLPEFATRTDAGRLALTAGLVVVIALSSQLRDFAASMLTAYTGEKLLRNFRAQLFGHVQRLSLSYQETRGTADSTYRIQYDAASVQQIAAEGMIPFVTSVFTVGALIYVTARMNWQLALVALSISLARAFLKGAPVLILDEPTSSVDARTEAGIVEAMERLMRGRTTFIIAHRLSTLKHCDILIRIEHGRVLSAGPAGMVAEKVLAALDATTYGRKTSVEDRT